MFWFMNSKHPSLSACQPEQTSCICFQAPWRSYISIFVMSHFRLQTGTSISPLLTCRQSWCCWCGRCQSPLADQLSLVFTIYRGLMSHYQMSYPTWHHTLAVLQIRSDVFLFQSEQAWLMIFSWEKKISTFTDGVITNNLNNNDKEKLWMEIFFPFEWISLRYLVYLFWRDQQQIFMEISGVEQQHPCKSSRPQW